MTPLQSKKLIAAIGSILTLILVNVIGLDKEVAASITGAVVIIAGIYLGGQSAVDVTKEIQKPKSAKSSEKKDS